MNITKELADFSRLKENGKVQTPQNTLIQMIIGTWISQSIYAVAKLGIADIIKDEVKSIKELAKATDADTSYLYRLLRTLASIGIFTEVEPQRFALTEIAQYLRKDVPHSLHSLVLMLSDEWHWNSWGDIVEIIKTGQPALCRLYQASNAFEYFEKNPIAGELFNHAMSNASKNIHTAVVDSYDFSNINKIVDVAGGHGTLIASILKANLHIQGILFDMPNVVTGAKELLQREGVMSRCQTIGGNFFTSIPGDGDAYIMSHIIHDWSDEDCIKILKNIRKGITAKGKLLVIETVIPSGNEYHFGKWLDLDMLTMYSGGRERTKAEFEKIFQAAGFNLNRIVPTTSHVSVIEGICA
ncbi:MAG: methyltransferase [Calothrix sp. MO_167.B12]|nr:methyltransferase [Calothrix sp. MO_167.B12]